jgi:hypothetical protein
VARRSGCVYVDSGEVLNLWIIGDEL